MIARLAENSACVGIESRSIRCKIANMFYLKQLVGSTSSFPYTLGVAHTTAFGAWSHYDGTSKEDNSSVSIFKLSASKSDPQKLQAARNGVKRLKSVCFKFKVPTSLNS